MNGLQVLVEDSARVQKKYPTNTAAIALQQENVTNAWEKLKEKSALRSDQLAASCDLQTFLTQVRDLMLWASNLRATLQAEEHVRDAAGATALKIQHDAIYNEIEAREDKFRYLSELSDSMVQTGHYAASEVEERCSALLDERSVCIIISSLEILEIKLFPCHLMIAWRYSLHYSNYFFISIEIAFGLEQKEGVT